MAGFYKLSVAARCHGRWLLGSRSARGSLSGAEPHGEEYGFASLGPIEIHVSRNEDHDPATTAGCAYLDVADADALWRQWRTAPGGKDVEPVYTDYGIREGAHIDPDGNLLRYGSRR